MSWWWWWCLVDCVMVVVVCLVDWVMVVVVLGRLGHGGGGAW